MEDMQERDGEEKRNLRGKLQNGEKGSSCQALLEVR
jgi:hypothetical protein